MAEQYRETFTREELPAFFRKLADACEKGTVDGFPNCTEARKISLSIKDEYGQLTAKLKMSARLDECELCEPCACETHEPEGLPKYKRLKKRMATSFKVIFKSLHTNTKPPEEAVLDFIADARLMTQYPGKGDALYANFNKLTDTLEEAWQTDNLKKFHETIDALNHMKTECHHVYK